MARISNVTEPASGANWLSWGQAVDDELRSVTSGGFYLDSYTGTDDAKLTSAIADQQAAGSATNKPPIILPSRQISFTTPRTLYNGCKVIGVHNSGQKTFVGDAGPEITLGGSISSGTASWWNGTGGDIYDVYMSDFGVQGSQSGAPNGVHQFMDVTSGTLYGCEFHSLSFNFMRGVFGRSDRKCLFTQVCLSGSWTMNNAWGTQMHVGGSDCIFFMDSFNNVGVSQSSSQTGSLTRYFFIFDSLEATVGKSYVSAMNGWRGVLISGQGSMIELHGGVYEGYKPTRVNGLLAGPAPGSIIKITGGATSMFGTKIGQGMDNPDASEDGLVDISGGEVSMYGCNFYGLNMGTENAIRHTGGRLHVHGSTKRQNEGGSWTGRPKLLSTASAPSQSTLTSTYTLDHDHSMDLD